MSPAVSGAMSGAMIARRETRDVQGLSGAWPARVQVPPRPSLRVPFPAFASHQAEPGHANPPNLFSKTFHRLVARSGLPVIRLDDLRHASLLQISVFRSRSRASDSATLSLRGRLPSPMTVYPHVLPDMQAEAVTTFADLLFAPE